MCRTINKNILMFLNSKFQHKSLVQESKEQDSCGWEPKEQGVGWSC
jgi:hypothetical protein